MSKKITYKEVKDFILENSECSLLSLQYVNSSTKMKFRCKCGNIFETTFDSFKYKNKRQCNKCGYKNTSKKLTISHKKFIEHVYTKVKDEYTILGKYKNAKTKLLIQHNKCGHKFLMTPDNFLNQNNRCPRCNRPNHNKDTEQFKKEIFKLVKDEYSVLGKYINANTKVNIRHNQCGYEWDIIPNSFLRGTRCPKCSGNIKNKTTYYFKNEVNNLVGNEYTVLGQYINKNTKITIKHNICGFEYRVTPDNFLRGRRCPKCSRPNYNMNTEDYKKIIKEKFNREFEILGEYVSSQSKILTRHTTCNNLWYITPSNLLSGYGCPYCNESKGEKKIREYLIKRHIKYKSQYKILECKNKYPLPFDFAIFNKNKLIALIEYQGIQHYKPLDFFGGTNGFKKQRKNDIIKKNYCKLNNILFIEIPYTIKNIENYLNNQLK